MARGSIAKENVIKKMAEAFGSDFIGTYDKKIYVWAVENGERVQIALSLTCPKVPIEVAKNVEVDGGDFNFDDDAPKTTVAIKDAPPAEITQEEKDNIAALMERLGL